MNEIEPAGVTLREFEDYDSLRQNVFDSALDGMSKKFPQEYGKYRLELENPHYVESGEYDLGRQKDALMKNQFLAKRLRGTLKLYEKESGSLVDEQEKTLMRVPYITDRGTTIHNGNEYVTLNQARLSSGIYTRKKQSGEIESHINAKRGTGKSFRLRLEPESSLYKLDIDQASLRLYSLLHDLGISDDELEKRWGPDILASNKGKYDSRTLDKAYTKLVRYGDPEIPREEKIEAIKEAMGLTRVARSSAERTLPNLFNSKQASAWRKYGFQQNPAMQNFQTAGNSDEFVKWDQKRQELEAKAQEKQEKAELKKDLDERRKILEIQGLNADILGEDGAIDNHAVVKQVMQNIHNRQKTEKNIATKKVVKKFKHDSKQEMDKVKSEDKLQDRYYDIKDKAEEERVVQEREQVVEQVRAALPQQQIPEQPPIQEMMQQPPEMGMPQQQPMMPEQPEMGIPKMAKATPGSPLDKLLSAKEDSDNKRYHDKHQTMRDLMWQHPQDFEIDSKEGEIYGITHNPTNFRMHLPKHVVADLDIADSTNNTVADKARQTLGLPQKSAKIERYQQNPNTPHRRVETSTDAGGQVLDVTRLNELVSNRASEKISLEELTTDGLNRSKATGFGSRRYEDADTTKPILIDSNNNIVDGRHRYFKLLDNGRKTTKVIRVSDSDIASSYADNNTSDFENDK
jgi:DNA-directed RNA polymerase beta subunit